MFAIANLFNARFVRHGEHLEALYKFFVCQKKGYCIFPTLRTVKKRGIASLLSSNIKYSVLAGAVTNGAECICIGIERENIHGSFFIGERFSFEEYTVGICLPSGIFSSREHGSDVTEACVVRKREVGVAMSRDLGGNAMCLAAEISFDVKSEILVFSFYADKGALCEGFQNIVHRGEILNEFHRKEFVGCASVLEDENVFGGVFQSFANEGELLAGISKIPLTCVFQKAFLVYGVGNVGCIKEKNASVGVRNI